MFMQFLLIPILRSDIVSPIYDKFDITPDIPEASADIIAY